MGNIAPAAVALLAAISVLLIFLVLAGGSSVNERLRRYASPEAETKVARKRERQSVGDAIASSDAFARFNRVVEARHWGSEVARDLAMADLALKPSEFLAIRIGLIAGLPFFMILSSPIVPALANPLLWVGAPVVGYLAPRIWLGRRKAKKLKAFNSGLADTITLIANALRAGSSFLQAIDLVTRETQPPISTEFARVIREVNLGLPMEQALANMGRRLRSDDLDLMNTAITIQHQVGGNLAEILDSIAFTIRERIRIKGEIRVLTAQQRISGYLVASLPFILMGVVSVIQPGYMGPMFQRPPELMGLPMGVVMLSGGGLMMFIGFMAIRRIVDIEV